MRRRNFLKLLGLAFVAPKAAVSVLKGSPQKPYMILPDPKEGVGLCRFQPKHVEYSQAVLKIKRMNPKDRNIANQLAISMRKTLERHAAEVFNSAFTTRHRS
jgi:hypothetical protein